jgi:hypothetical protein
MSVVDRLGKSRRRSRAATQVPRLRRRRPRTSAAFAGGLPPYLATHSAPWRRTMSHADARSARDLRRRGNDRCAQADLCNLLRSATPKHVQRIIPAHHMLILGPPAVCTQSIRAHLGSVTDDSLTSNGEMVDVPPSPVRHPPHQRLPRTAATSARLVPVPQDSSTHIFAQRTRQKPSQTHALEPNGSRKLLTWPPWHSDCFFPSPSRHALKH